MDSSIYRYKESNQLVCTKYIENFVTFFLLSCKSYCEKAISWSVSGVWKNQTHLQQPGSFSSCWSRNTVVHRSFNQHWLALVDMVVLIPPEWTACSIHLGVLLVFRTVPIWRGRCLSSSFVSFSLGICPVQQRSKQRRKTSSVGQILLWLGLSFTPSKLGAFKTFCCFRSFFDLCYYYNYTYLISGMSALFFGIIFHHLWVWNNLRVQSCNQLPGDRCYCLFILTELQQVHFSMMGSMMHLLAL